MTNTHRWHERCNARRVIEGILTSTLVAGQSHDSPDQSRITPGSARITAGSGFHLDDLGHTTPVQELLDNPVPSAPTYAGQDPIDNKDPSGTITTGNYKYDRKKAVKYAKDHGPSLSKYNPDFPVIGENDCTNFLSQVLLAGKTDQIKQGEDRDWWWDANAPASDHTDAPHPKGNTQNWYVADLMKYWVYTHTGRGTRVTVRGSLKTGDVLFMDIKGYPHENEIVGVMDHAMIVTEKYKRKIKVGKKTKKVWEIKIAAHTNEHGHYPWENLEEDYKPTGGFKGWTFYYTKLKNTAPRG